MPDTGAPWNIPYVDPTDLVRDYPQASEDLAEAIADGLDAAGNAGIGSNAVQTVKTNAFTTTSASFVDVTGLEVTITPTSDTAKVFVLVQFSAQNASNAQADGLLLRDSTAICVGSSSTAVTNLGYFDPDSRNQTFGHMFVDSPATASSVTYKYQVRTNAGTLLVNRSVGNDRFSAATIIAIEVAA